MKNAFLPNQWVPDTVQWAIIGAWALFALAFWFLNPLPLMPSPSETASAFVEQWQYGAAFQMLTSLVISLEAIFFASVIGLGLAYLATIPAFRPPVEFIGKLRFLSLTGVIIIFILLAPNGHALKVSVLTFAIVTFLINDMLQVIADIPPSRFEHARTMGLSRWQVLREVVIRGTLGNAFESIRMNAAMSWMMLTMVEGLSRSEGGIGVLLLNLNRHMDLAAIFGIQIMIFVVGIGQDALIKWIKAVSCPYTVRRA